MTDKSTAKQLYRGRDAVRDADPARGIAVVDAEGVAPGQVEFACRTDNY